MESPLEKWLNKQGLTQIDLALVAECSQGAVSNVARGRRCPDGSLREFLELQSPGLTEKCDKFTEKVTADTQRRFKAA